MTIASVASGSVPSGGGCRSASADIRFGEVQVSREHLRLVPQDGGWVVVDLSSRGTFLNSHRLDRGRPTPVHPADILELGRSGREGAQRVLLIVA